MTPDQGLNPGLQEWVDARQREADFSSAIRSSSAKLAYQQKEATITALRDIAETGDCGHGINLQNAFDFLHTQEADRTEEDRELFDSTLDNLSQAFGADNAIIIYRAWERRPQTSSEE